MDEDSGVSSAQVTPVNEVPTDTIGSIGQEAKEPEVQEKKVQEPEVQEPEVLEQEVVIPGPSVDKVDDELDDLEDDEIYEESILERIVGLGEMFPEGLRSRTSSAAKSSLSATRWVWDMTRAALWGSVVCFTLLALPTMIVNEKVKALEDVKGQFNSKMMATDSKMRS